MHTPQDIIFDVGGRENFDEVRPAVAPGGSFQKAIVVGESRLRASAVGNFAR